MHQNTNTQTDKIIKHIESTYEADPEFLWPDRYPSYAVFRHESNKKWFALIATISSKSLDLKDDKTIDIINLKFDKNRTYDFAETNDHIFPAYHMNKNNWLTIWLDGTISDKIVLELIKKSYLLSDK